MAGIKISSLPAAPSAQLTDVFPVDQLPGPVTYKESNLQLLSLFQANGAALTSTNDTNVTMTLGGAPTISLLNATSMTLGWTGQLSVPRGGTASSSFTAYSVICGGTTSTGALQSVVGLGSVGEQLTSNGPGMLPTWQTGTAITPSALTKFDDTNVTLTLGGTPSTALLQATSITAGWTGQLAVARGGTGVSSVTVSPTATAFAGWDANLNLSANNFLQGTTLVTASGGTTILTVSSAEQIIFSGTTFQTAQMPVVATLTTGQTFRLINDTNNAIFVISSGSNAIVTMQPLTQTILTYNGTAGTTASSWDLQYTSNTIGVQSITGTANQVIASSSTGNITLSLPQDIATGSSPTFNGLTLTNPLTGANGGTGVNNSSKTITLGGNLTTSGAFASTFTMTNTTSVTFPTSGTLATTSQIPTGAALTKADDTNVTLTLGGSPTTALVNAASITAGWTGQLGLTRGGTAASLTASNGGIVYSTSSALAILSGTATAGQILQSGASAAPSWSTPTYPSASGSAGKILRSDGTNNVYSTSTFSDTYSTNNILYSNGANTVTGLATANSGVLVTSSGGVPSISSTLPAFTTSSITFSPTTGGIVGTTAADSAAAGKVGEVISSIIASGSAVNVTSTGVAQNLTSISLTAGDWDVYGNIFFTVNTSISVARAGISATTGTMPDNSLVSAIGLSAAAALNQGVTAPTQRINVSGTTTYYIVGLCSFVGTPTMCGGIWARRAR